MPSSRWSALIRPSSLPRERCRPGAPPVSSGSHALQGSLYLRPLLIGTGPILGLAPAPEYTFVVYASPVASYFKVRSAHNAPASGSQLLSSQGGQLTPINLLVETEYHRAAPGGTGGTKCIGNYSPVLKTQLEAKAAGYSDVVYLDARENKYIEEVSSCNIFVVKGRRISTPGLRHGGPSCSAILANPWHHSGTILPGITRKSIVELARRAGYQVEERPVAVQELAEADEVFCTVRIPRCLSAHAFCSPL